MTSQQLVGLRHRLAAGLGDNILNMASNVPVTLLVARYGDSEGLELGSVGVALLSLNLASGVATAVGVETLTIVRPAGEERSTSAEQQTMTTAVAVGIFGAGIGIAVLFATGIATVSSVAILALLPILVLQRQLRLAGHILDEHSRSARNSGLWLATSAGLFLAWLILTTPTPTVVVACWLAGACISVVHYFATWDLAMELRPRWPTRDVRRTSVSLGFEFLVDRGSLDLVAILLSAAFGRVFAGQLRLAQTLFGISNLLVGSARPTLLAETRRRLDRETPGQARFVVACSAAMAAIPLAITFVLVLLGEGFFITVFGASAAGAFALVPLLGSRRVFRNLAGGPILYLRVADELRISRNLRVLSGALVVVVAAALSVVASAEGALLGIALVAGIMTVVWGLAARKSLGRHS